MTRPPGDRSTWSLTSVWPALAIIVLLGSAGCAGPAAGAGSPAAAKAAHTTVYGAWTYWGATLGGGELVARSALGENAKGQLIYAASMSASPWDLATALVSSGARTAMELDINPEWVQLAYAKKPGWRLQGGVTGQLRPADQYLIGWSRDFIAVMAHG